MGTFAHLQKPAKKIKSANSAIPGRAFSTGQSSKVSSILHLQHRIENQTVQDLFQSEKEVLDVDSTVRISHTPGSDFTRVPVQTGAHSQIQTKLKVNTPGDIYEQEADRVAEQIVCMTEQHLQHDSFGAECPECQSGQRLQRRKQVQAKPVAPKNPNRDITSLQLQEETGFLERGGRPLPKAIRSYLEPRFGHDFSQIRVHADDHASRLCRSINAQAFTYRDNIYFGDGYFNPNTQGGKRLLAHELTHTLQQQDAPLASMIQCSYCDTEVNESTSFDSILGRIHACRYQQHLEQLSQLVPVLLQRAEDQDLYEHGHELVSLLVGLGSTEQLTVLLPRLERVWREVLTSAARTTLSVGSFIWGRGSTPGQLINAARNSAIRGEHAAAVSMLRTAFMMLQAMAVFQSNRLGDTLQASYDDSARRRGSDLIALALSYPSLQEVYSLMRSVLGMYPALAREHYAAGRQREGDEMRQINSTLWFQIREMEGLLPETDTTRGISMATLRVEQPGGRIAYEARGAEGNTELLNPLQGAPTPDELASTPGLWESMGDIMSNLYEQETWMARLYRHPEVVQEFGSNPIDMNNPDQRHRLFRVMYRIFQRDSAGLTPLDGILQFMEEYLQRFTYHTGDYNIRDMGQNYLDTDFPQDLTGRVIRDCGVYAITIAYDVYRLARAESINVRFEIFTMTDHALLLITEEDADAYFVVSNNDIEGPLYGNQISAIAVAFSESVGRDYVALPSISQPLGSTRDPDRQFRQQIWDRYQNVTRWGLLPEAAEPGEVRSEEERSEASYISYYEARREFDELATQVDGAINNLQRELQESEDHMEELERYIGPLTTAGRRLAEIFIQYAAESRSAIGTRPGAHTREWMLYQLYSTPARGQQHPLVRLARVILYYQQLGGTLDSIQQLLSNWMCTERESAPAGERVLRQQEFCDLVELYRQVGFPPDFDIQ